MDEGQDGQPEGLEGEGASASPGGVPRPGSGRTEDRVELRSSSTPPEPAAGDEGRLHPNKGRELQAARTGGRKLFDAARRQVFLEWLAATANVSWSAEKAGICYQTVWKHRMNDPVFAEAFDRALDQGVVRGRARLIETRRPRIDMAGDLAAPELDEIDPQTMLQVLREHERGRGGPAAGMGRKQGRRPRIATNAEVRAALVKRLEAYGVRIFGEPPSPSAPAAEAAPDEGEA
jgi:hypothetical protein